MSTVEEIEAAIARLPQEQFWQLTDRLMARRNEEWDRQMDEDAKTGRLDFLFQEADEERQAATLKDWPPETS
jgi:hypothetical protein